MAERVEDEPSQSIVCPLCLDVFNNASMLSCKHTFCTPCLERYDAAHRNLDHMVCPLCRKATKLDERRVSGLPANDTIKKLVDEHHSTHGGTTTVLGTQPKCTACDLQGDAVSFCYECGNYMCAKCDHGHSQLTSFFKGHQVVSMKDVMEGSASIGPVPWKCNVHKLENKDLFCEDCKLYVCLKCMVVHHRDHKIKNQADVEKELEEKVEDIVKRSDDKKNEFEKHIEDIETKRQTMNTVFQKLKGNIKKSAKIKVQKTRENERKLLAEANSLQRKCNQDMESLKTHNRQTIKAISSSVSLVSNDSLQLGRLETDSLKAHSLICAELEVLLSEHVDEKSLEDLLEFAMNTEFIQTDDTLHDLGQVSSYRSRIENKVDLATAMSGMAPLSEDSILVSYTSRNGADKVEVNGKLQTYNQGEGCFKDIALKSNTDVVVSKMFIKQVQTQDYYNYPSCYLKLVQCYTFNVYNTKDWRKISENSISNISGNIYISSTPEDEIIATHTGNQINIYSPTLTTIKLSISTKEAACQARATRSGLIVASSCNFSNPSIVRVYDRNGRAGDPITADQGEYLYPAVDNSDRVFVATVNQPDGKIRLTIYELDGLNLKTLRVLEEVNLTLGSSWCYLYCLSSKRLAFACGYNVYFLRVYID